jgi:hypothetical protein
MPVKNGAGTIPSCDIASCQATQERADEDCAARAFLSFYLRDQDWRTHRKDLCASSSRRMWTIDTHRIKERL